MWCRPLSARLTVVVLAVAGALGAAEAPARAPVVHPPPTDGRFDYQIGGAYRPASGVSIVERDRHGIPVAGVYSICYVNAFQTQPEEAAWWKRRHPDLLLTRAHGGFVEDPGWPGELLLDTSTGPRRAAIAAIVGRWISGCSRAGFRAVEPDNLDSWTRSGGRLTRADAVASARLLVSAAHTAGLAVAQKNTPELAGSGRSTIGFDFAVAEECQVYRECDAYTRAYGRHVIEIEYTDNGRAAYAAACRARGRSISVLLRDRDVVPRGRRAYRSRSC